MRGVLFIFREKTGLLSVRREEARLRKMQSFDADIPKIALMPQSTSDVLTLLAATLEMQEQYADRPIITMSMAKTAKPRPLAKEKN